MKRSNGETRRRVIARRTTARSTMGPTSLPRFVVEEMGKREVFLEEVKKDITKLQRSIYVDDKEFVMAVVTNKGYHLEYASEALRNDKDIVLAAVANDGRALKYASHALRNDKEVVLAAVNNEGQALKYASEALRNDKDIVLAAVTNKGYSLKYASEALRNDKEVVLAAVAKEGCALDYASEAPRNDKDVVLAAVNNEGQALKYASEALQNDNDIVLAAVTNDGWALQYASHALRNDREVVLAALSNNVYALGYASAQLQADKGVVLAAVTTGGCALEYASPALRADREVVLAAVNSDDNAFEFVSRELLDCTNLGNVEFVQAVIRASSSFDVDDDLRYFPGLVDEFAGLFEKIEATSNEGNLELEDCGDMLPHIFAEQWVSHLLETRWCLDQVCTHELVPAEVQQHIIKFYSVAGDIQTANLLKTLSPILCALFDKTDGSFASWWEFLVWFDSQ